MAKYGFIHDKLDIKMLVLYLLDRAAGPISPDLLTELSLRHNGVEYFDLIEATAELVTSGHLRLDRDGYSITEKITRRPVKAVLPTPSAAGVTVIWPR